MAPARAPRSEAFRRSIGTSGCASSPPVRGNFLGRAGSSGGERHVTVLVTLEAVVIALLAVLVAGLLRSHAEILRKLHALGVSPDATAGAGTEMPVQLGRTAAHSRDAGR